MTEATVTYVKLPTLGAVKAAIKKATAVYVWCNWEREDGSYIKVPKKAFLESIGADTPFDPSGHGGRHDATAIHAEMRDDELYVG